MILPANRSSSSSSSSSTSSTSDFSIPSSSATTNLYPLQDNKSLKRKRSQSSIAPSLFDYSISSRPESIEVAIKTEEQGLEERWGLCQKQKLGQEGDPALKQEQESFEPISTCPALLNDVHVTHLPRASSALIPDIVSSTFNPEPQFPIPTLSHYKDQGTQTHLELPLTETYLNWSGRGRSPFKTPAIAAIDNLKKGAKLVEWLERQVNEERSELEKVIQRSFHSVNATRRVRYEIVQNRMDPLQSMVVLPKPAVDEYAGRSSSPDKYIAKMRFSTPPIQDGTLEDYPKTLPEQVKDLLILLEGGLSEGCMPSMHMVILIKSLDDRSSTEPECRPR